MNIMSITLLGILLAIIYFEITEISPGGIIVPALLVAYINQYERIIYTILVSIITCLLVRLLSKVVLIFGKRRFVLMILVSLIVNFICLFIFKITKFNTLISINIVGYTISGILANECYKQGIKKTIPSLLIVTCVLELIVLISNMI